MNDELAQQVNWTSSATSPTAQQSAPANRRIASVSSLALGPALAELGVGLDMDLSPIVVIERIAKSEDRARAIIFFLFFSRFEYALKRAGWTENRSEAKADWDKYAHAKPALLAKIGEEPLRQAQSLFNDFPPEKQVVNGAGLGWEADHFPGSLDLARLFVLVRRVRNNLFHGGKFTEGPEADISRDGQLIEAGITIMQACLDADEKLRHWFLEELA